MKKLTVKSLFTTFIFLLIVLVFSHLLVFNPLYDALEEAILENFVHNSESNNSSFKYVLESGLENAAIISSRTMIKNKIIDYNNGLSDLEELREYTLPKYLDGVKLIDHLIYSERITDNNKIADFGESISNLTFNTTFDELSYEFFLENEDPYLVVYSPIKTDIIIARDIIVLDLTSILDRIKLEDILIDVIKKEEIINYKDKETLNPSVDEYKSKDDIVYLSTFYELDKDAFLHISAPKDRFYNKFDEVTKASAISVIVVFVLLYIGTNLIVISLANKKIVTLDESNEKHKRDSYYDTLTGAYTRLYLNNWLNKVDEELNYSMVFIDIDNFKYINDNYGHQTGDDVLVDVVTLFDNEIRENDFIVRYGGDEFIILLDSVSKEIASNIIQRINKSLQSLRIPVLDIEISFSYGIGELKNKDEFYDVLKEIDLEMYQMKKANTI